MMLHRRLLVLAGPVLGWIGVSVLVMLLASGLSIALGFSIASLLAAAVASDAPGLARAAMFTLAVLVFRAVAAWLRDTVVVWVGIRIRRRLRGVLLAHLGVLGPEVLTRKRSGELAATIVDGVESLDPYYSRYLPSLIVTILLPITVVAYLWTISPTSGIVLLLAAVIATVPGRFLDATLLRRGRERWAQQQRLSADFLDGIQAIPTLRILGATSTVGATLSDRAWGFYRATVAQLRVSLVESGVTGFAVYGGAATATVIAGLGAWRGEITAGEAFVVLLLSREVFRPVNDLGAAWHAGYLGLTAADGIDEFLQTQSTVVFDGDDGAPARQGSAVHFEKINYRYRTAGDERWAVRNVDLEIPGGATVAIVGASGSGKTTTIRLLQRMDDPVDGRILLDGRPLSSFTREALIDSMAVVSQHSMVFAGTIAENISLGRPDATKAQIEQAAIFAEADEFIRTLPDGYDTVLGEFGAGLSGGQRQRLAIARAVLQDRPLLVLDEATAHLDVRTEAAITRRLSSREGRTTIIITHRLESVQDADAIILLEHGRVAQHGPYEHLRASDAYRRLEEAAR